MDGLKLAISSMSLGRAWVHSMPSKLSAASKHNILGLEVFYEDLKYLARTESNTETPSPEALLHAASTIKSLCDERNITIIGLQPFNFYEGLKDRSEHHEKIEKMKLWFKIVKILGTDLIQILANFLPKEKLTDDMDTIISASCDRKTENVEKALNERLERLAKIVDVKKVFYIQVVDAEKMQEPLVKGHAFWDDEQPARMSWSRNARLFAGESERGAYLPVEKVTRIIVECLGYQGWVSMELFNRSMAEEGESVPDEHARRVEDFWKGIQTWIKWPKLSDWMSTSAAKELTSPNLVV
ncbi:uncharacterized protein EAF01_003938 [Botrytis porri]|uniref:uncharacterized protein n=1 Tax=Botrytis porri TaxID=87229 RepID=UPI0019010F21|nr:uncharacterized protein EAF01_003938 [Botrytis porri]KAF7908183.1 hypothetical protein EAF01_003938 [Botrytis porri]